MDNNANESGSRVTRSLRKRLTSVDSDNSSRPGTPVPSKLTAISEITASPSRSTRMTRRNSTTGVATPVKTPAKRGAASSTTIAENTETVTPARRSTRRRSVSVFENEETNTTGLKTPAFAALNEETTAVEQTTARVTRSQSKSPQQIKLSKTSPSPKQTKRSSVGNKNIESSDERKTPPSTQKRRKIGPKSKTRENNLEGDSDVEISVFSNEMENIKNKSNYIPTIVLTDDESNQTAQSNLDEDNPQQKNEISDTIKVVTDENTNKTHQEMTDSMKIVVVPEQPVVNVSDNDVLNEVEMQTDNTNTNAAEVEKEISDAQKNKISDTTNVVDPEHAVVVNDPDDVLNNTEVNTNIVVGEVECPESSLENLESKPIKINELKVVEITSEQAKSEANNPLNERGNQNEKKNKTSFHIENMDSADQNTHQEECESKEIPNQVITTEYTETNDAGELSKHLGNENDLKEIVESATLMKTEMLNNTNADNHHSDNEINPNEIVKHTTETGKETCNNTDCEKNESMQVDGNNVIINNTLNGRDLNDVNIEEKGGTNSITQDIDSTDRNMLNVEILDTPQTKQKLSSDKIEILSVSNLTPYNKSVVEDSNGNDCKAPSKKVDFISSPSNDMTIKNVYPKTPASAKISNSFIEINSSPEDDSFQAENKEDIEDNNVESSSQVDPKMTPIRAFKIKRSLDTVQSSTPINVEALKTEGEIDHGVQETSLKDDTNSKEEIKWINPSVKGTTGEGSKLDVVVTSQNNTSASNINENNESVFQQVQSNKKKSIIFSSEDEDEHYEGEHSVEEDEELAPGEKPYKRKHDFHDDEAMEVDDYESGDSMNSEERREIEENEIPIDGESIGSHTTEDDHDESVEEEESDNADSFIVSDNEEVLQFSDSNEDIDLIDEDNNNEHNRKKKKTYKRVQRPADSSSSSEEENIEEEDEEKKRACTDNNDDKQLDCPKESPISQPEAVKVKDVKSDLESLNKSSENMLDSSKLSDSALRLQCTAESESETEEVNTANEENMNISRKEILRKLNQSDRFNKSVRDLNPEIDTSPVENCEDDSNQRETTCNQQEENSILTSSDDLVHNKMSNSRKERYESHLGEVSVTSESDGDKENQHKSLRLSQRHKLQSGLSVSFGSYKKPKNVSKGRQEWQRSFTIDVSVKDGDLVTEVTNIKESEEVPTSSDTSTTSTDERENVRLQNEDIQYLENIRHMPLPLCNPLIRTRRQSLALPTNPDMEICSSSHGASGITGKKPKRKSLGVLSNSEFNPSQSFIDSIELQKNELVRQIGKRKRLSKSFCGASDSLDSSIIDIDVRHLHKRSKLLGESSMVESHHDSIENINSSKLSTKYSSTPHQKKINENDSNNNIQHILNRCDEILEAANRAKLEAKLNNKKNKGKISKKLRKKSALTSTSDGTNSDDALRRVSIEIKRKDKIKSVVSQALRAGNAILGNKKQNPKEEEYEHESKRLPPEVLRAIEEESSTKKKIKKDNRKDHEKKKSICTASTSAGNFMELPQTPEKKKKKTFIKLPTGKVCVEPVTPQKRSVHALNGAEFRESPVTPYAVGFKVRQISKLENNISSSGVLKNGKRKRHHDETPKERSLKKSQWTQSGLFIEEEIPKNRRIVSLSSDEIQNINRNFKENALMRPEVKRGNKREILLLKERRQIQSGHY